MTTKEQGASDVFVGVQTKRAGKIKGESTASGHVDDILVRSWSWGLAQATAVGSTQAVSRRTYKALTFVKWIDSASTGLMSVLATNDEVKELKLSMRKQGGDQFDYFVMTLKGARIISVDHVTDAGAATSETVSVAFTDVSVEYRTQRSTGGLGGTFSFNDQLLPT